MTAQWSEPLARAAKASLFFLAHVAVAAVLILGMAAIHWLLAYVGEPALFGRVPLAYLFDAADLIIFLVFAFYGTLEAIRVLRGGEGNAERGPDSRP